MYSRVVWFFDARHGIHRIFDHLQSPWQGGIVMDTHLDGQSNHIFRIERPDGLGNQGQIGYNHLPEIQCSNHRVSNSNLFNPAKIFFIFIDLNDITELEFLVGQDENTGNHIAKYLFERESDTKRNTSYNQAKIQTNDLETYENSKYQQRIIDDITNEHAHLLGVLITDDTVFLDSSTYHFRHQLSGKHHQPYHKNSYNELDEKHPHLVPGSYTHKQ